MTSEYALIVTVNYIQSNNLKKSSTISVNKYNNNTNIIHILYEASIFVIDWGANLKVVNKLFLPLYYTISNYDLYTKAEKILNCSIEQQLNLHDIKIIYIFGDNQIFHRISCLQKNRLKVIDIRNNQINNPAYVNLQNPYVVQKNKYAQNVSNKIKSLPRPSESINNLCLLISKNLVSGYYEDFMYFNIENNSYSKYKCCYHKENINITNIISLSKCVIEKNQINRISLMFFKRAQLLINKYNINIILIEFIYQCLLLMFAFPKQIFWKCMDSKLEIKINNIIVMTLWLKDSKFNIQNNFIQYFHIVRSFIKNFDVDIKKINKINHQDTFLIKSILNFLT